MTAPEMSVGGRIARTMGLLVLLAATLPISSRAQSSLPDADEVMDYVDEGEVVRTMVFEDIQEISGKQIPMTMILRPEDKPDERTVVEYEELELNVPVEEDYFTRQGLRRVARG